METIAARGTQAYQCVDDVASAGGAKWVFLAPSADLYDRTGATIARTTAAPTGKPPTAA